MSRLNPIKVTVNGVPYEREVEPRLLLSDFFRHELGLTGTHVGCEHGVCGACTILFDGEPMRSCLIFAVQANGHKITTVEGLGTIEKLHPLQDSLPGTACPAMRLLHAWFLDGAGGVPGKASASSR